MIDARLTIHPRFVVGEVTRRLFGSFVEHMGRGVYGGIYDPEHPDADEDGFRRDVIELVRGLGVSALRYPGGNFVSGYDWEDGIGPRDQRPRRLNTAWHSTETNQVGLHEFASFAEKVDAELMMALNLGTAGTKEAMRLVEYANATASTELTDRRRRNGRAEPFGITTWYLGNEMDGPWQLGYMTADDYGKVAARVAKALRQVDPSLELVACGSSHRTMKTFGDWERTVLGHTYNDVDAISCHAYYEEKDGDLGSFLASSADMDAFIDSVVATADHVKALKRSSKTINISFDEWNVWYLQQGLKSEGLYRSEDIAGTDWPVAPRVAEDTYCVADAVVVGSLLISLLNHADRVSSACLSMLVNTMAPIRTEPDGPAWRQTTYFPFALTSRHAAGNALKVLVDCGTYETAQYGEVPLVAAAACHDAQTGGLSLFVVNRSQDEEATIRVDVTALGDALGDVRAQTLSDEDVHATNSAAAPDRVQPRANTSVTVVDGELRITVPPVSWTVVTADAT